MTKISITRNELIALLEDAYERGLNGYLDLKENTVLEIIKNFEKSNSYTLEELYVPFGNPPVLYAEQRE